MSSRSRLLVLAAALLIAGACATRADGGDEALRRAGVSSTTATTTTSTTAPASTTTTAGSATPVDATTLRPPAPVEDAASLAARIVAAETTLRDPASDDLAMARAALSQQAAYRQLGARPEWDAAVLAAVPPALHPAVTLNATARREFRAMHSKLSSTLPSWRIVAPEPAERLLALYREAEAAFGIPWKYLAAINLVETATGRIRGTSSAGAQGPMQFMPATWAAYGAGGDVHDTRDAILGAARYLAANNGATDIAHALYRYNHSDHYVLGVRIYADLIAEHPRAFEAYHGWGVWYATAQADVYLPVGYEATEPIPVAEYLAAH